MKIFLSIRCDQVSDCLHGFQALFLRRTSREIQDSVNAIFLESFTPQRFHRIDSGGAAGTEPAREQGDQRELQRNHHQRQPLGRRYFNSRLRRTRVNAGAPSTPNPHDRTLDSQREMQARCSKSAMRSRTRVILLLLAIGLILTVGFSTQLKLDSGSFETLLHRSGVAAPVVFSLLMIVGILVSPIPTSPLTILSPKLFGIWGGLLITLVSATIGAALAFLIARKLGDRFFVRFSRYQRFQSLVPRDVTAFAIFLLRLPPSPTFDLVSYLAGLTNLSLWQFLLATFLGMIPVTATLCLVGSITPAVWLLPALAGLLLFWLVRATRARK
jgi:uncharacterized membrane protein YdjX (TVP38/TMEM64 family)